MTGHPPQQQLLEVLEKPLATSGLDLEGVEISQAGRRSLVRVLVDQDGGVTLDDIADADPARQRTCSTPATCWASRRTRSRSPPPASTGR